MRNLLASSEGAAVIVGGAGRPDTLENIVTRATREHERDEALDLYVFVKMFLRNQTGWSFRRLVRAGFFE